MPGNPTRPAASAVGATGLPYRCIGVGVDGSEAGWTALSWACDEAEASTADLILCHTAPSHGLDIPTVEGADPVLARHLHEVRDRLGGQRVGLELAARGAVNALLDLADRADLLVLGAAATSSPAHLSTVARVAAHAPVPVVVVRVAAPSHSRGPFAGHVVVGVDGSGASRSAIGFAFRFARHHRVPLAAVHVSDQAAGDFWFDVTMLETHFTAEPDAVALLATEIEPVAAGFGQVPVKRAVLLGAPVEGLRRAAQGALLLVLGRHGHRLPAPLRLGSVSRAFADRPPCVVAIVGDLRAPGGVEGPYAG